MNSPADQSQRLQALDVSQSFIVQAPAGSGKTELLTRRFLRLLAVVDKPESVLAITFTKKAASEMLNRILKALRIAEDSAIPIGASEREQYEIAKVALARDRELGWNLLDNPGRLRVSTVDSLSVSLVRQMPFLSRLGAPPAIVEDASELYRDAARRAMAQLDSNASWAAGIERTLDHLGNDWGSAENLLIEMLGKRDQWLRHVAGNDRSELETGLRMAVEADLARARNRAPEKLEMHLSRLARFAAENIDDPASPINHLRDMSGYPEPVAGNLGIWQGLATLLMTEKNDWRKSVTVKQGFPKKDDAKEAMLDLLNSHCIHYGAWREALAELRKSPPLRYEESQWETVEALATTMKVAAAQLQQVFAERGQVDFIELSQRALQALETEDGPTDLAYVLDGRIEHILMDEFQDTSFTQYLLLRRLTNGWSSGDNRSLFLVGDPMQSIYRFREAEVALFLDAWQNGLGDIALKPLSLTVNFRSQAGIVDWVNTTFDPIFPRQPDRDWGAVSYAASVAAKDKLKGLAVHCHPFLAGDEDSEADRVVEIACDSLRSKGTTVAILTRARDHVTQITRKLQARGQRYQAVELDLLKDRTAVRDLDALLKALLFPANRVAWLAVLRAPWCGLTLAELEAIAGPDKRAPMLDLLSATERSTRLDRIYRILSESLAQRKRLPLARWLENAWLELGGAATLPDEAARQDARRYLEFVNEFDRGGEIDNLAEFDRGLEKLYAKPDPQADGNLQVMTMHKAKGLEFDVVILAGLGNRTSNDSKRLLYWLERADRATGSVVLAPASEAGADKDPIVAYINSVEKKRRVHEDARLLYVAATRARKELHLVGTIQKNGKPNGESALATLWDAVGEQFRAPLQLSLLSDLKPQPTSRIERFVDGWQVPAPPEAIHWNDRIEDKTAEAISFDWSTVNVRLVGTVVHRLLERISGDGLELWPEGRLNLQRGEIIRQLEALGVANVEVDQNTNRALAAVTGMMADTRGRWVLEQRKEARSEWELTGEIDGYLRSVKIDRSFVDEHGDRWIIDFKTGAHEGADVDAFLDNEKERYRAQLESYARLVSAFDNRPIRLGLYFPLLKGWREWTFERAMTASGQ